MTDSSIYYSIIIPHKNIPALLQRCLESIPKRDDTQILVIDDNSSPEIVDFENFPAPTKNETEVILSRESKGAGYARNIGLSKAKGKWLIFADADDFFSENLNDMMDKYKDADADIIFFLSESVNTNTLEEIESRGELYNVWLRKSVKKNRIIDEVKYNINPPWSKFFSKKLVDDNEIQFDEVFTANDVMFSTKCGHYARKVEIDLVSLYCSTVRKGSLDLTHNLEHLKPRFSVALSKYKFLSEIGKTKYRMNVWYFLYVMKELDKNWLKNYVVPALKTMKINHFIGDFFSLLKRKFYKLT